MFNSMLMKNMRETGQPEACPRATKDLELNLENRQKAIDTKMYGPANPQLDESGANEDFWQKYADQGGSGTLADIHWRYSNRWGRIIALQQDGAWSTDWIFAASD